MVPRIVSFRSFGIPFQSELFPSTISLHWSRDWRSFVGRRKARSIRMASNGEDGGADGINLTSRARMSPAETVQLTASMALKCGVHR
jgi:hypothetical protein